MDKYRIKIEGNPGGKYFCRYDSESDKPIFTNDVREAGEFLLDSYTRGGAIL